MKMPNSLSLDPFGEPSVSPGPSKPSEEEQVRMAHDPIRSTVPSTMNLTDPVIPEAILRLLLETRRGPGTQPDVCRLYKQHMNVI